MRSQVHEGVLIHNINSVDFMMVRPSHIYSSDKFMKVCHSLTVRSQVQEGMLIHNINFAQSTSMMVHQSRIYCSVEFMCVYI